MPLFLSYVAARDRETGKTDFLAYVANTVGGGAVAVVAKVHETLRGPTEDGATLREKYSDAIFVVDNTVRAQYSFKEAGEKLRKRLEKQLADARAVAENASFAADHAKLAADAAKSAADARKAAGNRVKELERELAKLTEPPKNEPKPEQPKGGAKGVLADLLKLDDAALAASAAEYKVERKADQSREDFAREIAKAAGYEVK